MTPRTMALAAAAVLITQVPLTGLAHAKKSHGTRLIEKHFETPGPLKGYSGFAGGYYCNYQRVPNRQCTTTASGAESCKIVSWTLKQACY